MRLDSTCEERFAVRKRRALEPTLDLPEPFAVRKKRALEPRLDLPEPLAARKRESVSRLDSNCLNDSPRGRGRATRD